MQLKMSVSYAVKCSAYVTNNTKYHNFFNRSEIDRVHIVATLLKPFIRNETIKHINVVNTIAILFLCYNAYMNYEGITHMWDMFQDFERLLIEILTVTDYQQTSIMIKLSDNAYKRLNELRNKAKQKVCTS